MPNQLLKTVEAAAFLRVGCSTLAKLRVNGGGPSYRKFGRTVRYNIEDLIHWTERRKVSSTSERVCDDVEG